MTAPHSFDSSLAALHASFLAIVPRIERHGRVYFRHVKNPAKKEEFIAEMVALSWKWCRRLAQRGKDVVQFPSAIASYAARAVRSGRRLCGQERGKDVLSQLAQTRHGFTTSSLPDYSTLHGNPLEDALAENTVTPVDEQVAFRLDFPQWLATYPDRDRRIALDLMAGERTQDVSGKYGLSPGRISQMRMQFHDGWSRFCDGPAGPRDDGRAIAVRSPTPGRIDVRPGSLSDAGLPFPPEGGRTGMSHIVTIQTRVHDPAAVAAACKRLGLAEPAQGKARLYGGQAEGLLLQLPGWRYPAVIDVLTGAVRYDNFQGLWGEQQQLDRFLQCYAVEKAKAEARKKGYQVSEQSLQDGSIKVQIIEAP